MKTQGGERFRLLGDHRRFLDHGDRRHVLDTRSEAALRAVLEPSGPDGKMP